MSNHHHIFCSQKIIIRKLLNKCFQKRRVKETSRQIKTSIFTTDFKNSIYQRVNSKPSNITLLKCHHCTTC